MNERLSTLNSHPIFRALAVLLWGIASFFIASFAVSLLIGLFNPTTITPLLETVFSALVYVLGLALALFVPAKIKQSWKASRSDLGLTGLPTWLDIALAIAGYIIYLLLAFLLNQLFATLFSWYDPNQAQDVGYNNIYGAGDRFIAFVSLVVIAPVAEEILFRGWIYGKVRKYLPLIPAILLVSIAFGLMHGQWNAGLATFALSLVFCSQREITGTIYASIILHMLNNALAFYVLYIA